MNQKVLLRIDPKSREKLLRLARSEGKSASLLLREIIDEYANDREIWIFHDDLWARIGRRMKAKGYTETEISRTIETVRRKKSPGRH